MRRSVTKPHFKRARALAKGRGGFTIVEVLSAVAISSLIGLGVASLLAKTAELQKQAMEIMLLEEFKQNMLRHLAKYSAWQNTLAANRNGTMSCLWNHTGCTAGGATKLIVLQDASNNLIFDSRNGSNGLTSKMDLCPSFSTSGNGSCPFRYEIFWEPVCTGACVDPDVSITANLIYSPDPSSPRLVIDPARLSIKNYIVSTTPAPCDVRTQVYGVPGTYTFKLPSAYTSMLVELWGGGGGGLAVNSSSCARAPGGAGGPSSFGTLVSAAGGPGGYDTTPNTLSSWNWCIWMGFPVCGVITWPQCPGSSPSSNGGRGYPETNVPASPPSLVYCGGTSGAGGGAGGAAYGGRGSAGGGGGAGNYSSGSQTWWGMGWSVVYNWYATGGGGFDPANTAYAGKYSRGVFYPTTLAPGSSIQVKVGAGGARGVIGGANPGGHGANGLVKITWQ